MRIPLVSHVSLLSARDPIPHKNIQTYMHVPQQALPSPVHSHLQLPLRVRAKTRHTLKLPEARIDLMLTTIVVRNFLPVAHARTQTRSSLESAVASSRGLVHVASPNKFTGMLKIDAVQARSVSESHPKCTFPYGKFHTDRCQVPEFNKPHSGGFYVFVFYLFFPLLPSQRLPMPGWVPSPIKINSRRFKDANATAAPRYKVA
ncbi:hypothetical protein TRVL_08011 [Trypanosoma vivax]|nr:hypothetical protein TRVL_08011 [Trypanosoma vivax]